MRRTMIPTRTTRTRRGSSVSPGQGVSATRHPGQHPLTRPLASLRTASPLPFPPLCSPFRNKTWPPQDTELPRSLAHSLFCPHMRSRLCLIVRWGAEPELGGITVPRQVLLGPTFELHRFARILPWHLHPSDEPAGRQYAEHLSTSFAFCRERRTVLMS
eukprot:scaffold56298_cov15-Tisochrysis_lutea.AAC.1